MHSTQLLTVCHRALMGLALCWLIPVGAQENFHDNPRAGVDYYLSSHGQVPPETLPQVYTIFSRIKAVADRSAVYSPELVIVDDKRQASAFVLSDGRIFLSRAAIDIFYDDVDNEEGNARLAFVLGHELAHLAANHFWDEAVGEALSAAAMRSPLETVVNTSAGQQRKELQADDQGFLYAALAGYRVDLLLGDGEARESFLAFWERKIGPLQEDGHPAPQQRTELLRQRLHERLAAAEYFSAGLRLAAFGRHDEAIRFYTAFQRQFPSRALFNNLGYAHLGAALATLDAQFVHYFWLPGIADSQSGLAALVGPSQQTVRGRGTQVYPPVVRNHLLRAADYFQTAIDKDPHHSATRVNLALANYFLSLDAGIGNRALPGYGRTAALAAVSTAIDMEPENLELHLLREIVRAGSGASAAADLTSLRRFALRGDAPPAFVYNLARLDSPEVDPTKELWREALKRFGSLPDPTRRLLCSELRESEATANPIDCDIPAAPAFPWPLPVELSRDLLEYPLKASNGFQTLRLDADLEILTSVDVSIVVADAITSLIVLKAPAAVSLDELERCCGEPLATLPLAGGTLRHYGAWAALMRNNNVSELWINDSGGMPWQQKEGEKQTN